MVLELPSWSTPASLVMLVTLAACLPTHPLEADDAPPTHGQTDVRTDARTQARAPELPQPSKRPEGVPARLWNDLHWLPADLVGINGAARGASIGLITWLRNQPEITGPACDAAFAGIETAYGIEWAEPPQSFVVYGSFRREDFEACARDFLATMGGSLVAESDTTLLELEGTTSAVAWTTLGSRQVAVVDSDRARLASLVAGTSDRLAGKPGIARLLARVDLEAKAWSASSRDFSLRLFGVVSEGLVFAMNQPEGAQVFHGELLFANEQAAAEAKLAGEALALELEQATGVPLDVTSSVGDRLLYFSASMPAPEQLARLTALLEARASTPKARVSTPKE